MYYILEMSSVGIPENIWWQRQLAKYELQFGEFLQLENLDLEAVKVVETHEKNYGKIRRAARAHPH